jgi:hypothetical protein
MTMDIYSHIMPDFKKSSMDKMNYLFKRDNVNIHPPLPTARTRTRENKRSKGPEMEF